MASATTTTSRSRPWIVEFYGSALGKKYAMAISGVVGLGFVLSHMVGNLKVFTGETAFNFYAHWLRDSLLYPILPHTVALWLLRIGIIVALVVHVHAAWSLTVMNRNARDVGYQAPRDYVVADFAARTMRLTGVVVLAFIGFHLADLTWGVDAVNPAFEHGEAYANLVASLSRGPVALFYIVANIALGVHLFHGIWSLFQTLGINNRRFNEYRRHLAIGLSGVIVAGNVAMPVAIWTGIIP